MRSMIMAALLLAAPANAEPFDPATVDQELIEDLVGAEYGSPEYRAYEQYVRDQVALREAILSIEIEPFPIFNPWPETLSADPLTASPGR